MGKLGIRNGLDVSPQGLILDLFVIEKTDTPVNIPTVNDNQTELFLVIT